MRRWRMLRNRWDEYPIEYLKVIGNLTHIAVGVQILKFGLVSSLKSYTFVKETRFSRVITGTIKSLEQGQNVESKFSLD
jgi:hypothetical protein